MEEGSLVGSELGVYLLGPLLHELRGHLLVMGEEGQLGNEEC